MVLWRITIEGPSAKRIPSIISATRTPEVISTDIPIASSCAQSPRRATPR